MQLFLRKNTFTFKNDFTIIGENEETIYKVRASMMTWGGRKLRMVDNATEDVVAEIHQVRASRSTVEIKQNDVVVGRLIAYETDDPDKVRVETEMLDFSFVGNPFAHEYLLQAEDGTIIAQVRDDDSYIRDAFEMNIRDKSYDVTLLVAAALANDMLIDIENQYQPPR